MYTTDLVMVYEGEDKFYVIADRYLPGKHKITLSKLKRLIRNGSTFKLINPQDIPEEIKLKLEN